MKLAQSLALVTGASFTILSALADFHIVQGGSGSVGIEACPSDYYNCKCMAKRDRAARVMFNDKPAESLPASFFYVQSGLCGVGQLNFYKQSDGTWKFYDDNGDGTLQGTCYPNAATTKCSNVLFFDQLVCYSNICSVSS